MGLSRRRRAVPDRRPESDPPGLIARRLAAQTLFAVLHRQRTLDELLDSSTGLDGLAALPDRDRALVRMLAATTLRRLGTLRFLLSHLLEAGPPKNAPHVEITLLLGAAQILFLDVPDHAAVDLSVQLASETRNARYAGLVNAVLRRVAREGRERIAALDPLLDTPAWLRERWQNAWGDDAIRAIAEIHRREPPLDLTAKSDPAQWAELLGARLLPNATIRMTAAGAVTALPGFAEGAWWVQDAAASLPARLLGEVRDLRVADLCAAPGGKTAQLAASGARVTAVDRSAKRVERLRQNLARLELRAETVVADATAWDAEPFDAVLLDAPCSATGAIRRHPDIAWQKRPEDIAALSALQSKLLDRAAALTRPGGTLVYATCSLEREESELQVDAFLARHAGFSLDAIDAREVPGFESAVAARGHLRTLPCHLTCPDPRLSGCDGFFAARLRRAV